MGLHIGKIAFPHLDAVISGLHILKIALLNSTPKSHPLASISCVGGPDRVIKTKNE